VSHCPDIAEKLLQFRDGTLPEEEMQHLRQHLHYCPTCLCLLNGYDEVVDVLERLRPVNMPADLFERMKNCVEEEVGCCEEGPAAADGGEPETGDDVAGDEAAG